MPTKSDSGASDAALHRASVEQVARLATTRENGSPHLVPITFALESAIIYSMVDSKPKSTAKLLRLENISRNPDVCVLFDRYSEDWSRLWWVRVDGSAKIVEQGPEFDTARALLADKYPQYVSNPPAGPAIVVDINRVAWWESTPGLLSL
jgi:PPOX class probable F420-dependent enzyme